MTTADQVLLIIAIACNLLIVVRAADARACAVIAALCLIAVMLGVL